MITIALGLAFVLSQTPPAPSAATPAVQPVSAELAATFGRILSKTPTLAHATGRALQAEMRGLTSPQAPFPVWVVEFRWVEKSVTNFGVAMFFDVPAAVKTLPEAEKEITLREGVWGLASLVENKTLEAWMEDQNAKRRALNEAGARAVVQIVMSAQDIFRYASGGSYGELACLAEPAACLPGSKEEAMIDPAYLASERGGYRLAFHAGAVAQGAKSSRLLQTWAFTAIPINADFGRRAFCGDSTGTVCAASNGTMPPIVGGACPKTCVPVQ